MGRQEAEVKKIRVGQEWQQQGVDGRSGRGGSSPLRFPFFSLSPSRGQTMKRNNHDNESDGNFHK